MKRLLAILCTAFLGAPACAAAQPSDRPAPIAQSRDALLDGRVFAISYSGYRAGQHPDRGDGGVYPTDEEVLEDLRILIRDTPFRLIRVYDSGPHSQSVLRVIEKHDLPIRVMLGAWLSAELSNPNCPWMPEPYPDEVLAANKLGNAEEVGRAIGLAHRYPEIVVAVSVGNEALVDWTDHLVPVESVLAYVGTVKAAIEQPVTVAENYVPWTVHTDLARELDFVSVHTYPIWEERGIEDGLSYTIENMQRVRDALPDAKLVIAEAGWTTTASEFGDRASEELQVRYYRELYDWAKEMNITTFFFEAFDESWKGDPNNPLGAEKHWGLYFEDRRPKQIIRELAPAERRPERP